MSLDNILAVTGAAKDHLMILIFGLALSIALMGVAANFIARFMDRYRWITYIGIALIAYVALRHDLARRPSGSRRDQPAERCRISMSTLIANKENGRNEVRTG